MSNPNFDAKTYIESNPYSAFGLLCLNNDDLQVVKDEDAKAYIHKYNSSLRTTIFTTLFSASLVGGLSAKFIPGKGILRGLGVAYLTVVGAAIGNKIGNTSTQSSYAQLSSIMRKYDHWVEDPKVIGYFESRPQPS